MRLIGKPHEVLDFTKSGFPAMTSRSSVVLVSVCTRGLLISWLAIRQRLLTLQPKVGRRKTATLLIIKRNPGIVRVTNLEYLKRRLSRQSVGAL